MDGTGDCWLDGARPVNTRSQGAPVGTGEFKKNLGSGAVMTIYIRPDGQHTHYPVTRGDARKKRATKYDSGEKCPNCMGRDGGCSIRYTHSGACVLCSRLAALEFYNANVEDPRNPADAVKRGSEWYIVAEPCTKAGHLGIRLLDHTCAQCARESTAARNEPRIEARRRGEMWYTPGQDCPNCGTRSPRRVSTNSCQGCERRRSTRDPARVEARRRGEMWYTPGRDCPNCGTRSPRRVSTNSCQGCEIAAQGAPDGRGTVSSRLMAECPDTIIDRQSARALGLKVYRTGAACMRGHAGWRLVSNGGCLECKKDPARSGVKGV